MQMFQIPLPPEYGGSMVHTNGYNRQRQQRRRHRRIFLFLALNKTPRTGFRYGACLCAAKGFCLLSCQSRQAAGKAAFPHPLKALQDQAALNSSSAL